MNDSDKRKSFSSIIRTIYLYLFSAVGLVLLLVGLFQTAQYVVKKKFLPKYYLGYEEQRCDFVNKQPVPALEGQRDVSTSPDYAKLVDEQKKECLIRLEEERKYKEVLDFATAMAFLLIGSAVFVFHFRLTRQKET